MIKINPALSGAKSLVYATYLGGSANGGPGFTSFFAGEGNGIAVDSSGDAYVTGFTESGDFPVKNPFLSGCPVNEADGCNAAFVTELNPQGSGLIYSTYLAGNGTPYGVTPPPLSRSTHPGKSMLPAWRSRPTSRSPQEHTRPLFQRIVRAAWFWGIAPAHLSQNLTRR